MKAAALGALLVYGTGATAALLYAGNVIQFGGRPDGATYSLPPSPVQAELPKPEVDVAVRSVPNRVHRTDTNKQSRTTVETEPNTFVATHGDRTKIRSHADGAIKVIERAGIQSVNSVSSAGTEAALPPAKVFAKKDTASAMQVDESKGVIYRPATQNQPAAIVYMPKSDPKTREVDENAEWREKLRKAMEQQSAGKGF